jgi:hypothetical protein
MSNVIIETTEEPRDEQETVDEAPEVEVNPVDEAPEVELNPTDEEFKQLREEIQALREYLSKKFTESERGDAGETDPIEDYLNSDNSLTHRILEKYERMN